MSKHYSIESLKEMAGGDLDFVVVIAKAFLEEIPPDLKAMEEAVANDNRELAYQFAHKMKPNLEMFGISLQKDITAIESWTKSSKNKAIIIAHLNTISVTLKIVFSELETDFNL